ncbi:HNH endonuclease [Arsenicitalea aurantiaca]|uniref:HNH endonuclease n=1 Tax=Arsenicitalea aurantiaca TaxID=1783274 RepID=UPI0013152256|nr:HNH endonuclease [Arsenicitalea aurantiaca]
MPSRPQAQRRLSTASTPIRRSGRKLTTTERGYGWAWQKLRLLVLADEPLCRICREQGRITAAEEVDHIDGNAHNNDRENLRPLCRPCHLARTARDQAFSKHQFRPEWLKPSTIPLVIVCGAPASGKSTWVRSNSKVEDLIIDLDVIGSGLSGQTLHGWDKSKWLGPAIRARNEMLGDIGRSTDHWPRAWLIVSEPKAENRQWWWDKVQPERIVVLETLPDICMRRVRDDRARPQEPTREAIGKWWSEYERRPGDEIIRGE